MKGVGSLGLKVLLPEAVVLFALAELGGWPITIAAGLLVGVLASDWRKAAVSGALGAPIGWGLYFIAYRMLASVAFLKALALVPSFLALTLLFGLILGLLSASLGYFLTSLINQLTARYARKEK